MSNIPKYGHLSLNIAFYLFWLIPTTYFTVLGYIVVILHSIIRTEMITLTIISVGIITYCVRMIKRNFNKK